MDLLCHFIRNICMYMYIAIKENIWLFIVKLVFLLKILAQKTRMEFYKYLMLIQHFVYNLAFEHFLI